MGEGGPRACRLTGSSFSLPERVRNHDPSSGTSFITTNHLCCCQKEPPRQVPGDSKDRPGGCRRTGRTRNPSEEPSTRQDTLPNGTREVRTVSVPSSPTERMETLRRRGRGSDVYHSSYPEIFFRPPTSLRPSVTRPSTTLPHVTSGPQEVILDRNSTPKRPPSSLGSQPPTFLPITDCPGTKHRRTHSSYSQCRVPKSLKAPDTVTNNFSVLVYCGPGTLRDQKYNVLYFVS